MRGKMRLEQRMRRKRVDRERHEKKTIFKRNNLFVPDAPMHTLIYQRFWAQHRHPVVIRLHRGLEENTWCTLCGPCFSTYVEGHCDRGESDASE